MGKQAKKQSSKEYHRQYREANREKRRRWNREWIERNRERYNASKYVYRDGLKADAMKRYSVNGKIECAICGFDDIDCLCLDHIDDNGAEHRKELGISSRGGRAGVSTYAALKRAGWPDGLQVLCANCNQKKELERKRQERMKNRHYKLYVSKGVMPSVKTDLSAV